MLPIFRERVISLDLNDRKQGAGRVSEVISQTPESGSTQRSNSKLPHKYFPPKRCIYSERVAISADIRAANSKFPCNEVAVAFLSIPA
eukprot:63942-Amorphochlora_amoeboformis.AAC.2